MDFLLESLQSRRLFLANLFQRSDGTWQANVTDRVQVWEFGRAGTAAGALRAAMFVAATESGFPVDPSPGPRVVQAQTANAEDLGL